MPAARCTSLPQAHSQSVACSLTKRRAAEDAYRTARAQLTQAQQRVERLTAARAQTVANDASTLLEHATELWRARMELIDAEHRALRAWVAWKSIDEAFLKEVKAYATRP